MRRRDGLLCEAPTPLEERVALLALELEDSGLAGPGWATGNLKTLDVAGLALTELLLLLRGEKVGVVLSRSERGILDHTDVLPLCDGGIRGLA